MKKKKTPNRRVGFFFEYIQMFVYRVVMLSSLNHFNKRNAMKSKREKKNSILKSKSTPEITIARWDRKEEKKTFICV